MKHRRPYLPKRFYISLGSAISNVTPKSREKITSREKFGIVLFFVAIVLAVFALSLGNLW